MGLITLTFYLMTNKTIKFSYYVLIGFIILVVINIFSIYLPEDSVNFMRKLKPIIGYFIFIPIFLITLILSIIVLKDYIKNKFEKPIKYFLMILPFLIYFIIYSGMFIYGVFIKQY